MKPIAPNQSPARLRPRRRVPGHIAHLNEVRAAQYATRSAEAWDLHLHGWPVSRIAQHLNVSPETCQGYFREELAVVTHHGREGAETWRQLEIGRLELLIEAWLPRAQDPNDPESARGAAIVIKAIENQSRLVGLAAEPPMEEAKETRSLAVLLRSPAARAALRRQLDDAEQEAAAEPCQKPAAAATGKGIQHPAIIPTSVELQTVG